MEAEDHSGNRNLSEGNQMKPQATADQTVGFRFLSE